MDNTFKEIHNQANAWEQTVPLVRERWAEVSRWIEITEQTHFLFIGCGTSYYLAESAARSFQSVTGRVSTAVPASEIFLAFDSTVPRNVPLVAFVISRSGTTSEVVNAARHLLGSAPGVEIVGVTCHTDTQLSGVSQYLIELDHAAEESVVMTQSFTSMLLALQTIAALIAGDDALLEDLARLPELLRPTMWEHEWFGRRLGQNLTQRHLVYLGLGIKHGLAQEATLKLKETTQTPCEAYSTLEFRHGPISIIEPGVAVVILGGMREQYYLPSLMADVREYGGYVAALAPYETEHTDHALLLPEALSDVARAILYLPALQFLAYYRALAVGLDPDQPRNLNQVVVI